MDIKIKHMKHISEPTSTRDFDFIFHPFKKTRPHIITSFQTTTAIRANYLTRLTQKIKKSVMCRFNWSDILWKPRHKIIEGQGPHFYVLQKTGNFWHRIE